MGCTSIYEPLSYPIRSLTISMYVQDMAEVLSFAGQKNVESPVDDSPVAQLMGMKQVSKGREGT